MSIIKGLLKQGSKPTGFIGVIVGKLMNSFHLKKYSAGLKAIEIKEGWNCLDIGCAGGRLTRHLARKVPAGKVTGLDHSPEMIQLAIKVNHDLVEQRKMKFVHGSVAEMPFDDNSFNLVTAAETVQFWPSLPGDFAEVRRVLVDGGLFLIMNRYPPEDNEKWMQHLQIKGKDHYRELLTEAGFEKVSMDTELRKGWILIKAWK